MTERYEDMLIPDQRDKTISRVVQALKANGDLSAETVARFRQILRKGKPIPGFNKDPVKAPPPQLKQHITERVEILPEFGPIIVEAWAEAEQGLREVVDEHLDGIDKSVFLADEMDEDFWDTQVALLAEKHDDFDEDDILQMTKARFAYAKMHTESERNDGASSPQAADGKSSSAVLAAATRTELELALNTMLTGLRDTPATAAIWQDTIPAFAQSLQEISERKSEERLRIGGLLDDLNAILSEFEAEFAFFWQQSADWDINHLVHAMATLEGVDDAKQTLAAFRADLDAYLQIQPRAETLAAEQQRREQRNVLEETIVGTLTKLHEIAQMSVAPADDTAPDDSQPGADDADAPDGAQTATTREEIIANLQDELSAMQQQYDELQNTNEELTQDNAMTTDGFRALQTQANALQGEIAGLNADKKTLSDEVAELKDQLRISEAQELSWRSAYESEVSNQDAAAPEPMIAEVESVRQALEMAEQRYRGKLVFRLNKKSDPDYNYSRPKEVWDALEWLAKTYHGSLTGASRVVDLDDSIRNTCSGWRYAPDQTDTTVNMYREWYTTSKDGTTYELRKHIGKGIGRDNNVIRIAFAWDEDSERVLVGYIGPHQRSRGS